MLEDREVLKEKLKKIGALNKIDSYVSPTSELLLSFFSVENISIYDAAKIVGVSCDFKKKDSGTVRNWLKGAVKIPYSSWNILLLKKGYKTLDDI